MAKLEIVHLKIDGMTCSHCEKTIEQSINNLNGIKKTKASLASGLVSIKLDSSKVSINDIIKAIEEVGYIVINKKDYKLLLFIFITIALVFYLDKSTNIFKIFPEVDKDMGYGLLFATGLLTSIHCIAMCGGINLSVTVSDKSKSFNSGLWYNLGRVISYTIIGALVGGIGNVISFNQQAKNVVSIIAGFFMFLLGIKMLGFIPTVKFKLPNNFSKLTSKIRHKITSPLAIGLLNGFMPCGPLQTMQIYALGTGSLITGALSMFFFALGTMPLMMGLSVLSSLLTAKATVNIKKASAILVILLGVIMFNRGFDLNSIIPTQNNFKGRDVVVASIKDGYQEVRVRFTAGDYKPIVVQNDLPVRWIIEIQKGDLNGCNNAIYINEFDIYKKLTYGDNIVEFTPTEEGRISYNCWMNMIRDYIYVVDDINKIEV